MPKSPAPESLFARLSFDRHIMARLADDLRRRVYAVLSAEEAGLDTATDDQQLAFAAGERRATRTFNIRGFAPLHRQCQANGRSHAGFIVSCQSGCGQYGLLLERMLRLLNYFTAGELTSNVLHLEQFE